jgi:hypothetical protein
MRRRAWVPDIEQMAQQLIEDYRGAESPSEGDLDALGTTASWQEIARDRGEEITEDDLVTLIQRLARAAAG